MAGEEKNSPQNLSGPSKRSAAVENGGDAANAFSPGFRSVAAMAGWDEEAIILATLVVEDTPERETKVKKRAHLQIKSPPTSSRRKRRSKKRSSDSIPIGVLNLDDEEIVGEEPATKKMEPKNDVNRENQEKEGEVALRAEASGTSSSGLALPCMDRLREELSCAICLEICFEPSTTTCGHSFCKKCLKSAADKCGKKCPKCRQLISNGRSCTVNTVLWNTIQLLFPQEVEARKAARALNDREFARQSPIRGSNDALVASRRESRNRDLTTRRREVPIQVEDAALAYRLQRNRNVTGRRRREIPSQVEDAGLAFRLQSDGYVTATRRNVPSQVRDAALAFRLQREEFMEAFSQVQPRNPLTSARANLRALASRAMASSPTAAINLRIRDRAL